MDKEQLQQEIRTKTKELDTLKSKIFTEVEEIKKKSFEQKQKKIEEEIHVLENQLNEFKKLEITTTTNQTQKESKKLKEIVEVDNDRSYEIIKWSKMYDKLLTVLWSESKVETFALDIDKVVRKYLDQELVWFPNSIKNSMSVGIQFAMMETLIKQWAQWSAQFFDAFSSFKSKSTSTSFAWLYKAFGTLWSANEFFVLANKVQNLTWYIWDHKNIIHQSEHIPELMDPNQLRILLNRPIWSNQTQIDALDITTVFTLHWSTAVDIHWWEAELKKIIDNATISGVITEKTVSAMQKSLKTADKLLDTQVKIKGKSSDLIDKIAWFLDIDIPFLGNLGEMMGMKFPTDILWDKKDGWVLNFVLWVLGFRGWISWLHKEYIKDKLEELNIDNAFILAATTTYQKNNDSTITHDSATSIWKTCGLTAPNPTIETTMKAKLPTDYLGLKKAMVDALSTPPLNPTMVAKFAPETIFTQNNVSRVDISKITDKDVFIDKYLHYIIPLLADPSDDFMSSKNIDKNSFIIAVMWGLVGDTYFIEGVHIWLITSADFTDLPLSPTSLPETPIDPIISPETKVFTWEITKETIHYTDLVNVIIDKIEGWYYHPDMNMTAMGISWETMMGIDRKHWWKLNTREAGKEFWNLIDTDRKQNPSQRIHNYKWGNLEPKLRTLAWKIIQPHYENLSTTYLSPSALDLIETDGRLKFNFIYWAWNWASWFQKMANIINTKVASWVKDTDELLKFVVDFRKQNNNRLIAQWGKKIEKMVGLA